MISKEESVNEDFTKVKRNGMTLGDLMKILRENHVEESDFLFIETEQPMSAQSKAITKIVKRENNNFILVG